MVVDIIDLNHDGRGIAKIDGKILFVSDALPGETVEIEIVKSHKKFDEARTVKVINESSERVVPKCPYYKECGGCDIMHLSYEGQLEFKKNKVKNILSRFANIDVDLDIEPSDKVFNYRNKITLHDNGYLKRNSNQVIPVDRCELADDLINKYINDNNVNSEELIIRTNGQEVISNIDNNYLIMTINDLKFRVDINSFFQVNTYMCGKVFDYISDNLEEVNNALDLYSGVGTLSIVLSKKARKVYSIEVNKYSHENAKYNLILNKISNIDFMCGKVGEELNKIHDKIDLIITDPPRSGMDSKTIEIIKDKRPNKIIYMSCDPITMARDLKELSEMYTVDKIKLFDMFPNTHHVESVLCLKKKVLHEMKLDSSPFSMIKSGEKTIELRLFDEKRQKIKIGDKIIFTNVVNGEKLHTTVVKLHRYNSFCELYKNLPLLKCGYTSRDIDKADPSDMEEYYSKDEQEKYGVVGIEIYLDK